MSRAAVRHPRSLVYRSRNQSDSSIQCIATNGDSTGSLPGALARPPVTVWARLEALIARLHQGCRGVCVSSVAVS